MKIRMRWALLALMGVVILLTGGCSDDSGPTTPTTGGNLIKPDGTGPYANIQAAITSAANGDTIELADGVFTGEGNRDIDFLGKAIVVRSASGNPESCIIDCQAEADSIYRGFIFQQQESQASVLAGIGIRNGNVWKLESMVGGGILCKNGSNPTLINIHFTRNHGVSGGGLACTESSSPGVLACRFEENQGGVQAGGILCVDSSSPNIEDSVFLNNYAYDMGGGIYCKRESAPQVSDSLFEGNVSRYGGGMTFMFNASASLTRVTFRNNTSWARDGGGVYGSFDCSIIMEECRFEDNSVPQRGGGVSCGGNSELIRCIFVNNSAGQVGGAAYLFESATISNSTFRGNVSGPNGGCIYCEFESTISISNSIIAESTVCGAIICQSNSIPIVTCTDIFGNQGGDWDGLIAGQLGASGNINENPLFCTDLPGETGFLTLHADSPCASNNSPCGGMGAESAGCPE